MLPSGASSGPSAPRGWAGVALADAPRRSRKALRTDARPELAADVSQSLPQRAHGRSPAGTACTVVTCSSFSRASRRSFRLHCTASKSAGCAFHRKDRMGGCEGVGLSDRGAVARPTPLGTPRNPECDLSCNHPSADGRSTSSLPRSDFLPGRSRSGANRAPRQLAHRLRPAQQDRMSRGRRVQPIVHEVTPPFSDLYFDPAVPVSVDAR